MQFPLDPVLTIFQLINYLFDFNERKFQNNIIKVNSITIQVFCQNSSRKLESALMQLAVKLAMTVQSIIHDIL